MSKLLILGASFLQVPAIFKAKEMGLYVAVADYNPMAVGIPYADEYFNVSTIDAEAICRIAEHFHPDGILTIASDMPMRAIAAATTKCGLPGISIETAYKTTDKYEMIKAFKLYKVESPWYYLIENELAFKEKKELFSYPCIIKPTDNSGSRGVILVKNKAELNDAYLYSKSNARAGKVIVEEFLQGKEVSVEVMVVNNEPHVLMITDKLTTGAPYFVEMGHCQPSRLPQGALRLIANLAQRAILSVGIKNGPAHVEIMMTAEGPKMIELGARLGGDCITSHLVPLSTGIDMMKATIEVALGQVPNLAPTCSRGSAIRYFDVAKGIIQNIAGVDSAKQLPGIREITMLKKEGDLVLPLRSSLDRVGFVISEGETAEEAVDLCRQVKNRVSIKVSDYDW